MSHLGTVLGVWAHPDDEAYLSAGLMAQARTAGSRVVVITATEGERGTDDPARWPPHVLGPLRRTELDESLAALGVAEHRFLGYADGGCADVPRAAAVARIAQIMDEVRPDTVLTFGPDGMTGHPDHRAVSDWTTAAWQVAGRPGRLWYATTTVGFHLRWGALNARIGVWGAAGPPLPAEPGRLAYVMTCTGEVLDRKHAALLAQRSQTEALRVAMGPEKYRVWWAEEAFALGCEDGSPDSHQGRAVRTPV
ncbi:PIG-L deacetylase family protein [Nonomuraea sp. NPDC050556]|uniref:PIG-L deacetylase family protein n=1 Tax=Nonomuraea sp. NPDC050556 TaxID=3364369 RepID=UPI00378865E6